jgi:hypothetical protein
VLSDNFYKLANIPFGIAIKKLFAKVKNTFLPPTFEKEKAKVLFAPTQSLGKEITTGYFRIPNDEYLAENSREIRAILTEILNHRFNLLGTGWIERNWQYNYDWIYKKIPDFWKPKTEKIFERLQKSGFCPINYWDAPKSKFQWNCSYHRNLTLQEGADVKEPWELGRMQHLPILAYSFKLATIEKDTEFAEQVVDEFQNQILDFIATNPPLYTIQWKSPMDCGIRLINWLLSYDLFVSKGAEFTPDFKDELFESIFVHIYYILNNLEWSEGLRGNHYFANLLALAFAGAYLPNSELSSQLLAFSLQEIINETMEQFFEDGGNFECSTMYHLQVTEMLLLALYLFSNLPTEKIGTLENYTNKQWYAQRKLLPLAKQKFKIDTSSKKIIFPKQFLEQVERIVDFTISLKKQNKEFDQIGDNDSGRILRLDYFLRTVLFQGEKFDNLLEYPIVDALIENLCDIPGNNFLASIFVKRCNIFSQYKTEGSTFLRGFEKFGLYIFRTTNYFISFRCGEIGQFGKGGHSHNDQLSFTFNYGGKDFIVDPGTYCYTLSVDARNKFRSVTLHNTLVVAGKEQNLWRTNNLDDLFWISEHRTKSKLIQIDTRLIAGEHYAYSRPHRRIFSFEQNKILAEDILGIDGVKYLYFHLHPDVVAEIQGNIVYLTNGNIKVSLVFENTTIEIEEYEYSPQYGLLVNAKCIVYISWNKEIHWRFELDV